MMLSQTTLIAWFIKESDFLIWRKLELHTYMSWTPFDWNWPKNEIRFMSASKKPYKQDLSQMLSRPPVTPLLPANHELFCQISFWYRNTQSRFNWAFHSCVSTSLPSVSDRRWVVVIKTLFFGLCMSLLIGGWGGWDTAKSTRQGLKPGAAAAGQSLCTWDAALPTELMGALRQWNFKGIDVL